MNCPLPAPAGEEPAVSRRATPCHKSGPMKRAILLVLDSFGVGGAEDAARFGDQGSDTFGHIAEACAVGRGNRPGLPPGPRRLPTLDRLCLARASAASTGKPPAAVGGSGGASGRWGYGVETARGK